MSESLCSSGGIFQAPHGRVHGNRMPTLVPSHGFTADQTVWHDVVPFFACFFKVVVCDFAFPQACARTWGGYAEDSVRILDELKLKRSICVGHSMSAVIGCLAAIRRPDLFKRLMLLSGSPSALTEFEHSLGRIEPEIAVSVAEILSDLKWALLEVLVPCSVIILRMRGHFPVLISIAYPLLLVLDALKGTI
ncbi:hypothetical protein ACJRO7_007623 [Eucalyptus globulus]|uniref:AB hydrolase-1 domain-containing protein n=1 Tax=Eucalyptus globulus TaxID=34317 RepID=A0ABD3ILN8_EUCGL